MGTLAIRTKVLWVPAWPLAHGDPIGPSRFPRVLLVLACEHRAQSSMLRMLRLARATRELA
jgi:hypothetical protein